jgi:hypothetical protein
MSLPGGYRKVAHGIACYLAARQQPDGAFPGPDHYGRAFAAWLWAQCGEEFSPHVAAALGHLREHLPADHGEFNAYALLQCEGVEELLPRLRFGHRHSANWTLLRAACRSLPGPWYSPWWARMTARAVMLWYGRRELIYDRPGALSHTYHAFCGALLADLGRNLEWPWATEQVIRAAHAILPHISAEGEALRVGRGARQIFGYGALLYLLESAGAREEAERVFRYLLRFRREDGSFPLVLDANEPPEPWKPAARPGWHDYNRYADYLPFLGAYLLKAGGAAG